MSICFPSLDVYLVVFGCTLCQKAVKDLFEDASVTKIIHDCRMDCDALYHLHRIQVNNVHDTSCFHGVEDSNLNDVLAYNGIMINMSRDKTVYKRNPRFWAARPLTATMIDWASSDVQNLFALADAQLNRVTIVAKSVAIAKSSQYSRIVCNMKVCSGLTVRTPSKFIGPRGQNIRSLQRGTGTLIYQDHPIGWMVFYDSESSLEAVKRSMSK